MTTAKKDILVPLYPRVSPTNAKWAKTIVKSAKNERGESGLVDAALTFARKNMTVTQLKTMLAKGY